MGAGSFHATPQDMQGSAERAVGGGGPPWGWAQLQDPVLWWSGPAASGQWTPWPLPARGSPSRGWWPVTGHNTVVGAAGPRLTPGASGAPGLWGSGCGGTASGPACGHLRPSALAWSWVQVPAAGSSPHRPFLWPCAPLPSLWPGSGHTWQHGANRSAPVGVGWAGRLPAWAPLPFSALSPAGSWVSAQPTDPEHRPFATVAKPTGFPRAQWTCGRPRPCGISTAPSHRHPCTLVTAVIVTVPAMR